MGSAIAATGFGWSESVPLLAGDNGTAQTIGLIRRAREQALRDPAVRAIAGRIVAGIPPNNLAGQCKAIYEWVKRNIAFVRDPVGHETVSSPRWTLQAGFGDCDDLALLIASMVGVVGIESRLVTVALQPNAPESFSHIYAEAFIGHNWGGTRASAEERWVTMDTARSNARFDREPSLYYRKRIWYFDPPAHQDVPGLSGMADWDWNMLPGVITSATSSIAQIFAASKLSAAQAAQLAATGKYTPTTGTQPYTYNVAGGIDSSTLMIGAAALLAVVLLSRK